MGMPKDMRDLTIRERRELQRKRERDSIWGHSEQRVGRTTLDLGEQCFVMRNRLGLTQEEAEQRFGVSKVTIIRYERGAGGNIEEYARKLEAELRKVA